VEEPGRLKAAGRAPDGEEGESGLLGDLGDRQGLAGILGEDTGDGRCADREARGADFLKPGGRRGSGVLVLASRGADSPARRFNLPPGDRLVWASIVARWRPFYFGRRWAEEVELIPMRPCRKLVCRS
jgi:hypothetical protein